jgi:hypothetical protein
VTQNVLQVWPEILGVVGGALVLLVFALAIAWPHRPAVRSASRGHRKREEQEVHEEVHPDGYIDSFSREIEEAGGALPAIVKLALPAIILWWLLYLIINWTPR